MRDIDDSDRRFLDRAIALSRQCIETGKGGPFGAVVARDDKILGEGGNEVTIRNDPTAHAEVVAIQRACAATKTFSLPGATIYASGEPCPMCLAAIYWAGIARIVYANTRDQAADAGFGDAHFYKEVAKPIEDRETPMIHCPSDAASDVFEKWKASDTKIVY